MPAVQRRAERAEIDQEERAGRRIAPDARVLAGDVGRRGDADVHRYAMPPRPIVSESFTTRRSEGRNRRVLDARDDRCAEAWPALDLLFPRRRSLTGVDGRDPAGALADAEVGPRRQHELGVDQQVAFVSSPSGSARNFTCQSPPAFCISRGASRSRIGGAPQRRSAVQPLELLGERAERLLLQDRDDAFEPRVLARVEVDGVAARRQRRIAQLFEVLAHVLDDRVDDVASRAPRRRCQGEMVYGRGLVAHWQSRVSSRCSWLAEL